MMIVKIKKPKGIENSVVKRKLEFENYKHCLETTLLENKQTIKKNNLNTDNLRTNHKEFIRKQ